MSKGLKLYVLAFRTMLRVERVSSIAKILPTKQEIEKHIKDQLINPNEKFQLLKIELDKEVYKQIVTDVKKKSSVSITDKMILISLGDNNHPIICITEKSDF